MNQHELSLTASGKEVRTARARLTVMDVIMMLRAYRWLIAGGLLAGLLAAAMIYAFTPEMFRAEARLLVRYVADTTLLDPGAAGGRVLSPDIRGENIINSEVEIFVNRASIEAVVDSIGATNFPGISHDDDARARAVLQVLRNVHIDAPRRSNIIRVQYDATTAGHALLTLKALVEAYLSKHIAVHRSAAAYEFLSKQADQSRARLAETEEELRQVKTEAGPGLASDSGTAVMQRIHDLRRQLGDAEARLAISRARTGAMRQMTGADGERASRLPATVMAGRPGLRERLARLETRQDELLKIYTEDSIPVRELRAQMDALLTVIPGEGPVTNDVTETPSAPPRWMEDAETAALDAQVAVLRDQLTAATAEALRLEQLKTRLDQLERTRQIQEDHYRNFARSMEQARINDALDPGKINNISLVQPAMLIAANYRTAIRRKMMLATGSGLILAVVCIPVYESITGGRRVRRLRDLAVFSPHEALLDIPEATAMDQHDAAPNTPAASGVQHHPHWSHYDALADRLIHWHGGNPPSPCIIGLAGCRAGAGVTTLSAGLAASLARLRDARVLLLNARNGPRHCHYLLGASSTAAGVDMHVNHEGHVVALEHNLFLFGADDKPGFMQGCLLRCWPDMLRMIRDGDYAFAVLNLPPVAPVSATLPLVSHLHSTVLVVQAGADRLAAVHSALQLLARYRARLAGTVLNRVPGHAPEWWQDVA